VRVLPLPQAHVADLDAIPVRFLNAALHQQSTLPAIERWYIVNPMGRHAIACGLDADIDVEIDGHVGYYCAGMNKRATVRINGNAGVGLAENMMSGMVSVRGDASQSAGATGHGGLLIVGGNVGHMSAFMAQAGNLVVLGDAGEALGDSIYEARIFVRGSVKSLGADCIEKPMTSQHVTALGELLERGGYGDLDPAGFRRFGSARRLYNFHVENAGAY